MNTRRSSIEILKLIAIFLIIVNHVVQTIHIDNSFVPFHDYFIDVQHTTSNMQFLILAILRYCGVLGNNLFFICSAWFLIDNDTVDWKKEIKIIVKTWSISVIIFIVFCIIRNWNIDHKLILKSFCLL